MVRRWIEIVVLVGACVLGTVFLWADQETEDRRVTPPSTMDDLGHGYQREKGKIYFDGQRIEEAGRKDLELFAATLGRKLTLCHEVDAATFVPLNEQYSKDRRKVYYKWVSPGRFWVVELAIADVASFEVLDGNLARDRNHVWWYGAPLHDLDPRTVQIVRRGFVWKDARRVWYQHQPIEGADPKTFVHLDRGFYKDAHSVYWCSTRLEGADPAKFRTFGPESAYGADTRHVWRAAKKIEGPDPKSFTPIHRGVYKDRLGVYEGPGKLIENARTESFRKVADLDESGTALLRDADSWYLHVPYRGEVFRLWAQGPALGISRSIWTEGSPRPAARVTAELTAEGWRKLTITGETSPRWESVERHILEIYRERFEQAWKKILKARSERGS